MASKLTIAFLAVFLFAGNIFAEDITPENAKKILDKALKLQKTRTYTATTSSGEGKFKRTQKIFQKLNPDGTTYKRIETKRKNSTRVSIKNDSGIFSFKKDSGVAIKSNYNTDGDHINYDDLATYKGKTGYHGKISCYIVRKSIIFNKNLYPRFLKYLTTDYEKKLNDSQREKMFNETFIALAVYHIGQADNFIYATTYYDHHGKLKLKSSLKNVNLTPKFDDVIFKLPVNQEIIIANNLSEFMSARKKIKIIEYKKIIPKTKKKARKRNELGIGARISSYFDSNFNSISSMLSAILFWSAMGLLVFAGIYKWKCSRR